MTNHDKMEAAYLEPPEDTRDTLYHCECCGDPIKEGDDYYEVCGLIICESCVRDNHKTA